MTKTQNDLQSTRLRTAASDGDWLTTATPFGAIFGASNNPSTTQLLNTRIDWSGFPPGGSVATTTITFPTPVPANALGFVLGDVDVDIVEVAATTAGGGAVTGAQLNGSAFNFCDVPADNPTSCAGVVAPFDLPVWNAGTRTLTGNNAAETEGASAWYRPTTSIASLTFTFSGQTGSGQPSYRLWLAVLKATVSGTVDFGTCPTQSAEVQLIAPDGTTVLATTTTAGDGTYSFANVVAQPGYEVRLTAPADCRPVGGGEKPADTSTEDVTVNFQIEETPTPTPNDDTTAGGTEIANTGAGTAIEASVGGALVLVGGLFVFLGRRRRPTEA